MKKLGLFLRNNWQYFIVIIILVVIFYKAPVDGNKVDTLNNNAGYHTLEMIKNLKDYDLTDHCLLPLVTMKNGSATEWGACLEGVDGRYYYCSFMPFDVIVPYLFFVITGLELTLRNLYILSLACAFLSIVILNRIVRHLYNTNDSLLLVAIIYLFSYEGIHCATNVFWGEILFQPVLLYIIWLMLQKNKNNIAIAVLTALGCMIDWSGYLLALAIIIVHLRRWVNEKATKDLKNALFILGAAIIGGGLVIIHYSIRIPLPEYFDYCVERFLGRSAVASQYNVSFYDLVVGYWNSYGIWIVFVAFALIVNIIQIVDKKKQDNKIKIVIVLLLITCFENILMLEHAIEYTYDRLKFAPVITIAVMYLYTVFTDRWQKKLFVVIIIVTSLYCYCGYIREIHGYVSNNQNYLNNEVLGNYFQKEILSKATDESLLVGLNAYCQVRGYSNLLFDCNIHEGMTLSELQVYGKEYGYDKYIYLLSDYNYSSDKYHYYGFLMGDCNDDDVVMFYVDENKEIAKKTISSGKIYAMPFSDRAFTQGVNLSGSTIRFSNEGEMEELLNNSTVMISADGEEYSIESVTVYETSIDVKLLGEYSIYTMKKFEFPNVITLK